MDTARRTARIAGMLYLATFATSFPALALKTAYLDGTAGREVGTLAAVLELLLAASCVGTAVVLLQVTRRVNPALGVGFVVSRSLEAAMIMVGVLAVFSVAMLRESGQTAFEPVFTTLHDATFLIGPAVMSAVNALLLGTVMLRGRLVPRIIPIVGLIGAPLLLASSAGVIAGAWTQTSVIGSVAAVPVALWELSLGIVLIAVGFRPAAIAAIDTAGTDAAQAPAPSARR